jgi:hydroxyacylglutathione hydrolase
MILRRFYDEALAQASYLLGCAATGEAIVIDPNRDIEQYLVAAEGDGVRITAVTETHIHADFVSGLRELADRLDARMYLSDAGPPEWQYAFRTDPRAVRLGNGDRFKIGNIVIEAVHTPGHTPEHLSFLVTDGAAATEPMGIATGDFVFVGDVGRPDLLEKAARMTDSSEDAARTLFRSLAWFKQLPDHLQVWPGHGAGSACGKGIGAVPQSTVGYERRTNWALAIEDEDTFVAQVLHGQPEPPRYFGVMKRVNREGPAPLATLAPPERLPDTALADLLAAHGLVVDTRSTAAFTAGHVPGTVNIPLGRNFPTYAGSLLPYDQDLYFLVDGHPAGTDRVLSMARSIGLDRVAGVMDLTALDRWAARHGPLAVADQVTPQVLAAVTPDGTVVLDVRGEAEWRAARIPGSRLLPLAELVARVREIPPDGRVVLACATGSRSAIAASLLRAQGRRNVANLAGGLAAWTAAGMPTER